MCSQSDSASDCSWWNSPSPFKSVSLCLFSFLLPLLFSLHLFITVWRLKEILLILWNEGRVSGMDRIVRGVMIGRRAWSVACAALMNGDRREVSGVGWRAAEPCSIPSSTWHSIAHPHNSFSLSVSSSVYSIWQILDHFLSACSPIFIHLLYLPHHWILSFKKIGWLIALVWLIWTSYCDK